MHSTRTRAVLRLAAIARTTFGDSGSGSSAGTRPKEPVRTPMKGKRVRRLVIIPAATVLLVAGASAAARADPPPGPVDESRLVPSLSASFAPWTCKAVQTGPVCNGERRIDTGWGPFDFSCGDTPVYARHEEVRRATRYYGWDYLNYPPGADQRHRLPGHFPRWAGDGDHLDDSSVRRTIRGARR